MCDGYCKLFHCLRLFITSDVAEESAVDGGGSYGGSQKELYNLTTNIKTYKREV